MNSIHRANTTFGPPTIHTLCPNKINDIPCKHKLREEQIAHCMCAARYNETETFCYGDKYLIVYNWFRNFRPLVEQFTPDKCFIVDEGHPAWRYQLFGDYKKSRIAKRAAKQDTVNKIFAAHDEIVRLL